MGKDMGAGASQAYADIAKAALTKVIGAGGASSILFYTGEPREEDFEKRLRGVLGLGADVILLELYEELAKSKRD
jgi:hypothetical protein